MLRITPIGVAVTPQFNAAVGRVTLPTVCTIRREAIRRGELAPRPAKKRAR